MFDIAKWRARWAWLDATLRVTDHFGAIGGGPLASAIALASFLSLFPLLLVAIAVVGFWSSSDTDFALRLVRELGLRGNAAETVLDAIEVAKGSRRSASIIGLVGLLWTGLGVVGSLQTALNAVWQAQGRGLLDKLLALRWLLGAGTLFLMTAALGPVLRVAPGPAKPLTILVGFGLTTVLFLWTYTSLVNKNVSWRVHLPGALLVALGVEVLKAVGSIYMPRLVASSSALYGSLGVVFAVLALLLIYSRMIVYGAVLNVVRYEVAAGTDTVRIKVPHVDGEAPITGTRGGAVEGPAEAPPTPEGS